MTVLKEGAAMAEMGTLMGFTTALFIAVTVAWTLWAYWPSRKAEMDAAALLPFEEEA